jgi:GMP synthase-like glutamine amidotransferase
MNGGSHIPGIASKVEQIRQARKGRLGILKAGSPPRALSAFGSYPDMFRKLLGEQRYHYVEFDVEQGELPADVDRCPAYLITGSASDAFGTSPWISDLKRLLNAAKGNAALVGICFGHQVMAEAFGGKVARSPQGWGMGNHRYDIVRPQPWSGHQTEITLPASHQDQVVELPPACEVVGCNGFSPFGFTAYTDSQAISLQLHPEFEMDFAAALAERQRSRGMSDEEIDRALSSLQKSNDRALVADWINRFITMNT